MLNIKMQSSTPTQTDALSPKIVVIGVGGAGGNAVNNMISSNLEGCDFIVCNTDAQALGNSLADNKLQLGEHVTGGLGAGSKPEVGRASAEESLDDVMRHLEGANMAFVTAGMGGGTGTGAAPIIAKACRDMGILTVGVVTKPFHFEGSHRMKMAEDGLEQMQDHVDTLIVIPNQNLFRIADEKTTFSEAFEMADSVLQSGVRGVTDLMVRPGLVNLDFADIRTAMMEMGKAMMGTGEATGEKRATEAAEAAINNPLLDDVSMKGAHGVIVNVTGGYDMTLFEADEAANRIRDEVDPDANIIFGATFDESMEGSMRVSIVATGIEKEAASKGKPVSGKGSGAIGSAAAIGRTTPNVAAATAPKSAAPAVSKPISATSLKVTTSESMTAEKAAEAAPKKQPESDLFEQQQYGAATASADNAEAPRNTALRGERYKNSFIPPKPATAGQTGAMPYHSLAGASSAPEPQQFSHSGEPMAPAAAIPAAPEQQSGGLKLNPPRLPNPSERQRSPSLFERISGTVQQGIEGLTGGNKQSSSDGHHMPAAQPQQSTYGAPNVGGSAPLTAPAQASQGSLNIDSPSAPKKPEDNLDIPAFLRRQAN